MSDLLARLRARLREKADSLDALKTKAFADGASEVDIKAFEDAVAECEGLEKKVGLEEKSEAIKARNSLPADAPIAPGPSVPAEPERKMTPKERVSLIIKAVAKSRVLLKRSIVASPMKVLEDNGFGRFAKELEFAQKVLTTGVAADGGYLVPTNLSRDFIPLLREDSVIMSSNPRIIDMRGMGNLTIPGQATGATAAYVGEAQPIPASQPSYKTVVLSLKKLAGIVPISNELLTDAVFDVDGQVTDDLIAQINLVADLQMLRGTGSSTAPAGILTLLPGGQKFAANATVNATNIIADLSKALVMMRNAKVVPVRPVWIMAPTVFHYLNTLRDTGEWLFPELRGTGPTLMGFPVKMTTHVPVNLGAGTNESEVYLIDFGQVIVGDGGDLRIDTSDEATVVISATPVSAFQNDMTYVRGIIRHDIDMRYTEAAVVITTTRWGT